MAKLEEMSQREYNRIRNDQELRFSGKKPREKELEHISIYAHEDGTRAKPVWLVEHHHVGEKEPDTYEIHHGDRLLDHIADHAAVPDEEE